ncbi:hypothetical protein SAMN05518672_110202 [Chitinophaga sp. CF118]|uniref:hypothetical protein n=1 Tax=Chitinophaga sp. CF118 TaxID=1884367 RepID=UPI0008F422BF|nr:hypothetical protein [Chitinophaga sp. CF118]SFE81990.1 hypothetical protein SAMN05518672_110202 [Chitinophaga sp. CF118]
MVYLKCKSCGHYNELRSEFLTFCGQCGKKLENNYSEWKNKHPESDFEEFQAEVGVASNGVRISKWTTLKQNYLKKVGRRGVLLTLILVIGIAAVAGGYFGKRVVYGMIYPKLSKSSLYKSWETTVIGRQAIEISTPMHLGVNDKPLIPEIAQLVEYAKSYRNRGDDGMQVEVNMYSYRPNISNDLEVAGVAAADEMKTSGEISDLKYTSNPVIQSGMDALIQQGSFAYRNAIRLAFCNLLLVNGQHRWQIAIRYREDDTIASQAAQRIIKSIRIK